MHWTYMEVIYWDLRDKPCNRRSRFTATEDGHYVQKSICGHHRTGACPFHGWHKGRRNWLGRGSCKWDPQIALQSDDLIVWPHGRKQNWFVASEGFDKVLWKHISIDWKCLINSTLNGFDSCAHSNKSSTELMTDEYHGKRASRGEMRHEGRLGAEGEPVSHNKWNTKWQNVLPDVEDMGSDSGVK